MITLISTNVNGLKAYYEKGAFDNLIGTYNPDILCLQETKCAESVVGYWISDYKYQYIPYSNSNHWKKGYAGVSTLVKEDLLKDIVGVEYPDLLEEYGEGRMVVVKFKIFNLINVYTLNSGDKDQLRMDWDERFRNYLSTLSGPVVIVGDLNVVPSYLDYWGDYDNAEPLPGLKEFELNNLNLLQSSNNLVDSFRELHPNTRAYSWFSYAGGARKLNHGWRIDLGLVSKSFMNNIIDSRVESKFEGSDHSPIKLLIRNSDD